MIGQVVQTAPPAFGIPGFFASIRFLLTRWDILRYNIFHVLMLMRHAKDGKIYLYDIVEIKKETSNLFQSNDFTQ